MNDELQRSPLATTLLIDIVCDRFEEACSSPTFPKIEDYLGELDEPARSQLLRSLLPIEIEHLYRSGHRPSAEEYVDRFSAHQSLIDELFLSAPWVGDEPGGALHSTVAESNTTHPEDDQPLGSPDKAGRRLYKVLRQHAEGGLGTVSVARDQQLNREVALKEIQPRLSGDSDSRSRFIGEAEITGRLEHPGIVPVYALDHHEDGRPFYVMRFVRGQTLRDAIKVLHPRRSDDGNQPMPPLAELRKLLRRFLEVCNTVAYAHSRGVIHRDLKPHNILLGPYGETLLVDWGLAKAVGIDAQDGIDNDRESVSQDSPKAVRPTLPVKTQQGRIAGTPGYMAPEQASGVGKLTTACDVFGLGATLFCLLTGRAPRGGSEPNAQLDSASQSRLTPPRQLVPRLPRALEAICLKAMHVAPDQRYASATALANDLDAWLEDEPVSSYRERPLERLSRWTRKNRSWVRVAAAALAIVATVATIAALTVDRARRRETTALVRANDNLQNSLQAIDKMLTNVGSEQLSGIPQLSPVRQALLDDALSLLESIHAQQPQDPGVRRRLARVQMRVGRLALWRDAHQRALEVLNQAREMSQRLREEFPASHKHVTDLMETHFIQARVHQATSQWTLAESSERQGLALFDELPKQVQQEAQQRLIRAQSLGDLAHALGCQSKLAEAESSFRQARSLFEELAGEADPRQHRNEFARMLVNYGSLLEQMGNTTQAEDVFTQSLAYCKQLVSQEQVYPDERQLFSQTCGHLAQLLLLTKGPTEATEMSRSALEQIDRLASEYPSTPIYRLELALALGNTAYYLTQPDPNATYTDQIEQLRQNETEITQLYEKAISALSQLTAEPTSLPRYLEALAHTHNNLGIFYSSLGDWEKAADGYRGVIRAHENIIDRFGETPYRQSMLGAALNNLAVTIGGAGDLTEARDHLLRAVECQEKALLANASHPVYQSYLRNHLGGLTVALALLGSNKEAVEAGEEAVRVARQLYNEHGDIGDYRGSLNSQCVTLARVLTNSTGEDVDHFKTLERARNLVKESTERSPHWRFYTVKLAELECRLGNLQEAEEALERAAELTMDETDAPLELLVRAFVFLKQGKQDDARASFDQSKEDDKAPTPSYINERYARYCLERLRTELAGMLDELEEPGGATPARDRDLLD